MSETIRELISEADVDAKIRQLGRQISEDYAGESVFLLCILKGGVFFTTELAKRITIPVSLDFMSVSSYGAQTESSGVVRIVKDLDTSIEGKNVLVVEDIIDTGRTLSYLLDNLKQRNQVAEAVRPARQAGAARGRGCRGLYGIPDSRRVCGGLWNGLRSEIQKSSLYRRGEV